VLIPVTLAVALVWTRHPAAGSWFVTAVAVDWLLGVATYFVLPTLGPIYSAPGDFDQLRHTYTTTLENNLWQDRVAVVPALGGDPHATDAVQTIAAFPSLHVGLMVTVCLFVTLAGMARWIRVTSWVFLALTVLATIYLGWHFSLDALGGAVLGTAAVWIAALGTGNHIGGRPQLVDRGSYDLADEVEQHPERVSPARG
jgi:membrane-associated phospholipid phosphatase